MRNAPMRWQNTADVVENNAARLVGDVPRPPQAAKLLGHCKAGLQTILVESGAEIGAAKPGVVSALERPELPLRSWPQNRTADAHRLRCAKRRAVSARIKRDK